VLFILSTVNSTVLRAESQVRLFLMADGFVIGDQALKVALFG
jgi:hypothetical protein